MGASTLTTRAYRTRWSILVSPGRHDCQDGSTAFMARDSPPPAPRTGAPGVAQSSLVQSGALAHNPADGTSTHALSLCGTESRGTTCSACGATFSAAGLSETLTSGKTVQSDFSGLTIQPTADGPTIQPDPDRTLLPQGVVTPRRGGEPVVKACSSRVRHSARANRGGTAAGCGGRAPSTRLGLGNSA